jgi:hypothetical protein
MPGLNPDSFMKNNNFDERNGQQVRCLENLPLETQHPAENAIWELMVADLGKV